jgi:hypothetical protein
MLCVLRARQLLAGVACGLLLVLFVKVSMCGYRCAMQAMHLSGASCIAISCLIIRHAVPADVAAGNAADLMHVCSDVVAVRTVCWFDYKLCRQCNYQLDCQEEQHERVYVLERGSVVFLYMYCL